jgi:SAM-dependent methyltransferase
MEEKTSFSDGEAYERFMGRWSRAAGTIFLDWIAAPAGARWIDVGCGTGAFTELVLDRCSPSAVVAVDPAQDQIEQARKKPVAKRADFRVGDAQALPFETGEFDVVASALVINFVPDRPRMVAEMRRVGRPGALVASYVWDFADGGAPNVPILRGLTQIGARSPAVSGTAESGLKPLTAMFAAAGLKDIRTRKINIALTYPDFEDFWVSQTPAYSPSGKVIASLSDGDRAKLKETVRDSLHAGPGGSITRLATANAIRARVP